MAILLIEGGVIKKTSRIYFGPATMVDLQFIAVCGYRWPIHSKRYRPFAQESYVQS